MTKRAPALLCVGRHAELSKSEAAKAAEIIQSSDLDLKLFYDHKASTKRLESIVIDLHGKIAHFPSKSNISHVWTARRTDMKVRLYALTQLYVSRLLEMNEYLPGFKEEKVHVALLCARHKVRFDSHNQAKALGDWLETALIIDNDSQAEVHAFKKEDYSEAFSDQFSTTLIIQRRQNVRSLLRETILELKNVAIGNLRLLG